MSIYNDLYPHFTRAYEQIKQNFFTAGDTLADRCLYVSTQFTAGVIANYHPDNTINRIALHTVASTILLLFILNIISLIYRITHVSTLAWAFACTSFLGIPAFIYFVLPLTIAFATYLISALRLPQAEEKGHTPMPFSHQLGLLCAAIIPWFFPIVFFIALLSSLTLLTIFKKGFPKAASRVDNVDQATITRKDRQYYVITSYIILFHTAHILIGSFPIVTAFSVSIVAASFWITLLSLFTIAALFAPQYMYQIPQVDMGHLVESKAQFLGSRYSRADTATPRVPPPNPASS